MPSRKTIWEAAAELKQTIERENEPPVPAGFAGFEPKVASLANHVVIEVRARLGCLRVVVSPKLVLWKTLQKLWREEPTPAMQVAQDVAGVVPKPKTYRGYPVVLTVAKEPRALLTPAGTLSAAADA